MVVEFQPSGWSKGSYLNVAAHWLWSDTGFLSFDFGYRVAGFEEYQSDAQFEGAARGLAEKAAAEAQRLTTLFSSIDATADALDAQEDPTIERPIGSWPQYNAAMAAGLAGRSVRAATLLASVADNRVKALADHMVRFVADPPAFRQEAVSLITRQRLALRLDPLRVPAFQGPP